MKRFYDKYVSYIIDGALKTGFNSDKEAHNLRKELIPVVIVFIVLIYFAISEDMVTSSNFQIQVLVILLLCVFFDVGILFLLAMVKKYFAVICFFFIYLIGTQFILLYVNNIYPCQPFLVTYFLFLNIWVFAMWLITVLRFRILNNRVKNGLILPTKEDIRKRQSGISGSEHIKMYSQDEPFDRSNIEGIKRMPLIIAIVLGVITLLCIITIICAWILGDLGENSTISVDNIGALLSFIALSVGLITLNFTITYGRLAFTLNRMMRKENILAHWVYSTIEWRQYIERNCEKDKKIKKREILTADISGLTVLIAITFVVALMFIVVFLITKETHLMITLVIFGIIAVTLLLLYIPIIKKGRKKILQAIITPDGIYINKQLYDWKTAGQELEKIIFDTDEENNAEIVFTYLTGKYHSPYTIHILVPGGQEEAAENIVKLIAAENFK
jgi:hypothetical protein